MGELSLPLFDAPIPTYYQGSRIESLQASFSGAIQALQGRGEKVTALRQLIGNHGPLTLNDCAAITGWPLSSICSLKAAIDDELEADGHEIIQWDGKTTRRTRWRMKR
jgi:hypothetical protein